MEISEVMSWGSFQDISELESGVRFTSAIKMKNYKSQSSLYFHSDGDKGSNVLR